MSKAKKIKARKGPEQLPDQINRQGMILILLVGMLVFYPPYFQGLFYKQHMFVTHILTSLVFVLVWADKWKRREFSFITGPLDLAVLGYTAAYALSLITAVVIGEAVYGFLRALNYFMIYWMITQVIKDFKDIRFILKTIIISALGVTVIGILAAAGVINYPQAFFDNHIVSTMGYHNTLATFLVIALMLGFSLLAGEKNRWWQLFYYIANYLMMLVVMAAVSKGAWLILVFGLVLMLIGVPREYRVRQIYFLTLSMLPAIITSSYFMTAVSSASTTAAIGFVVVGILPVLAGWFLCKFIEPWLGILKISRPAFMALINDSQAYLKIAELWWDVCQKLKADGQHEPALEFANEIIVLHFDLQRQMSRVKIDHHLWQGEKLKITPAVEEIYNQAQTFIAVDKNPE